MSNTKMTNGVTLIAMVEGHICESIGFDGDIVAMHDRHIAEIDLFTKTYLPGWCMQIDYKYRSHGVPVILRRLDTRYRAVRFSVTRSAAALDAGGGLRFTGTLDHTTEQLDTITQELNEWLAEVAA